MLSDAIPTIEASAAKTSVNQEAILTASVLGVNFHCLTMPQTLNHLERFIRDRAPRQICLSNAYIVSLAQRDAELRALLDRAALVLADGMSIVWGSRWIGVQIPCRVAGPDLMTELCALSEKKNYRIFLLGSTPDNVKRLENALRQRWPALTLAGAYSPTFCDRLSEHENQRIIHQLKECAPDILFVGMSAPKQEKWIAQNLSRMEVPVCLGVGAAFDFISGRIPRAPEGMRRIGLEWLYRLWREPSRLWKRYLLGNFIFLSHLAVAWIRRRLQPPE